MTPVVSTRRLFARLLRTFDVTTVCDVGSMDGADARLFRRGLPRANILAFEPNPHNYALMLEDSRLRMQNIRVLPFAASDREAETPFFVVEAEYAPGGDRQRRGMSSLHRRADGCQLADVVAVRTVCLDRFLAAENLAEGPLAFWIDSEGMALEVIRGAQGVLANTQVLHVEVETTPCIGASQHLFADVRRCLEPRFRLLATDQPLEYAQFNAIFVREKLLRRHAPAIRAWLSLAWLRRRAGMARRFLHTGLHA